MVSEHLYTGRVLHFSPKKQFGKIRVFDNILLLPTRDLFVHTKNGSNICGRMIQKNDIVNFHIAPLTDGRFEAINVSGGTVPVAGDTNIQRLFGKIVKFDCGDGISNSRGKFGHIETADNKRFYLHIDNTRGELHDRLKKAERESDVIGRSVVFTVGGAAAFHVDLVNSIKEFIPNEVVENRKPTHISVRDGKIAIQKAIYLEKKVLVLEKEMREEKSKSAVLDEKNVTLEESVRRLSDKFDALEKSINGELDDICERVSDCKTMSTSTEEKTANLENITKNLEATVHHTKQNAVELWKTTRKVMDTVEQQANSTVKMQSGFEQFGKMMEQAKCAMNHNNQISTPALPNLLESKVQNHSPKQTTTSSKKMKTQKQPSPSPNQILDKTENLHELCKQAVGFLENDKQGKSGEMLWQKIVRWWCSRRFTFLLAFSCVAYAVYYGMEDVVLIAVLMPGLFAGFLIIGTCLFGMQSAEDRKKAVKKVFKKWKKFLKN